MVCVHNMSVHLDTQFAYIFCCTSPIPKIWWTFLPFNSSYTVDILIKQCNIFLLLLLSVSCTIGSQIQDVVKFMKMYMYTVFCNHAKLLRFQCISEFFFCKPPLGNLNYSSLNVSCSKKNHIPIYKKQLHYSPFS